MLPPIVACPRTHPCHFGLCPEPTYLANPCYELACAKPCIFPENVAVTAPGSTTFQQQTAPGFGDKEQPRRRLNRLTPPSPLDIDLDISPTPEGASLSTWLVRFQSPPLPPARLLLEPAMPGSQIVDISFLLCACIAVLSP